MCKHPACYLSHVSLTLAGRSIIQTFKANSLADWSLFLLCRAFNTFEYSNNVILSLELENVAEYRFLYIITLEESRIYSIKIYKV